MKEQKREFSRQRLYKLTKILVIVITIFFGLRALLDLNGLRYWKNYCNSCQTTGCGNLEFGGGPTPKECYEFAYLFFGKNSENQRNLNRDLPLAVVPFLIFFGGMWLYKYLFPKNSGSP